MSKSVEELEALLDEAERRFKAIGDLLWDCPNGSEIATLEAVQHEVDMALHELGKRTDK